MKSVALLVGMTGVTTEVTGILEGMGIDWEVVESGVAVLRRLRECGHAEVVLVGPGISRESQLELCRGIKLDGRTRFVAVIIFRPYWREGDGAALFEVGADECLNLESCQELAARLKRVLRLKHATDSLEDATAIVKTMAAAIEGKDPYTCGHVDRVGAYAVEMGRKLGLSEEILGVLHLGGAVHDLGKVGVPEHILNKPGKLTEEEMEIMKRHPVIGYEILKPLRTFRPVLPIVRSHHEKPNGTGYPDGLKGEEIPLLAKIVAVADVFDALATDRPYRKGFPLEKCAEILIAEGKAGNLDRDLVGLMVRLMQKELVA